MEAGTPELVKLEDLEASRALTGRKHVLSLLVENRPGVLARIAGLFSRRGFNIDTLAVGPTDDPDVSRITLTLDGAVHPIDQVTKQLHKLVNVLKIRDMEPDQTISREMALFRVQASVAGLATYGSPAAGARADRPPTVGPTAPGAIWDSAPYVRMVPKLFEHMRKALGDDVELLHDVHERVTLPEAVNLCKALEPYRLFFVEDPLPPEENDHFRILRQQSSVPLAMGELFNTVHEYAPLLSERLIDFIRIHISQIGGLSPARKVQALAEFFGVRTAWHGPGDASPIAHAAQLALELASYNFGVHEGGRFQQATRDVFPGCPETKDGYLMAVEAPGLGIDIDEKAAAKFPFPPGPPNFDYGWGTTRRRDSRSRAAARPRTPSGRPSPATRRRRRGSRTCSRHPHRPPA